MEKKTAVELKRSHQEYIFGQWGLLIQYIILIGGNVVISYPKRKKYIDKRNQLDVICVNVEGKCWNVDDFTQKVMTDINELLNKNVIIPRDIPRTKRKDLHDIMNNNIIKWVCQRSERDGIKIIYKNGKSRSIRKEKESNLYIDGIEVNGKIYDRKFIRDYFGDWMQKVLKYFVDKNNKNKHIIISLATLSRDILHSNNSIINIPEINTLSVSEDVEYDKNNEELKYIYPQSIISCPCQAEENTFQMIQNDQEQFSSELNEVIPSSSHPEDFIQNSFKQASLL
ncbi:hypothetical protein EHI8A_082280 [Entamoeba histolytica HM-1:IMSS-B]|uniref:Uncharacterized protein n=6 Tax=Entamoeba histolytica TaxID=5759 RepID=C4M903_ENTH1|nr:hypothetical protein EHI_147860 [Entamoeba histolytica HM-1:IMSS]EMD49426.1 Hypothetical protein EHI5A_122550 [Entamoeba histolytica KU27]EMH75149.1 hypothetical protein EHI8A_082280 [Entamoeba histolytica HM-1:IMSS-B]EMS13399.1 hypothetical protein KM1_144960 [Entamoeba histolytica HM-3:IMSS]ENY62964.1 hypothetical protein EHI7A_080430 [Entamoeba histolytica HM-1:IMSS-A]GAT98119.1 hypothetical protein CL6EHI_147860 [Entamoeba histolytica]|eukprot:XP_651890.1 hypothetical protein EHI_147860 [Entamoeba histolytica HM-1:IMSS]